MMAGYRGRLILGSALAALAIAAVAPTAAMAQAVSADREIAYAIPAQSLSGALRQFAEASGLQLVYDAKITADKSSPGVTGKMSAHAALSQILSGSGLTFQFSGDRAVIVTAQAASGGSDGGDGIRSVGVVNVEGVSGSMPFGALVSPVNGTNGSRDVEATEGTGSYTTGVTSIVSKIPQALKDTPQTVSVATAQRIEDQNLNSIRDILQTLPGITTTPGTSNEEFDVFSRGFRITTYSYDGGAPVSYDNNTRPMLNMAEFDSVQLARGATGLFSGYGDPGGTVNLVRKKPLDHEQFTFDLDAGSYRNFREVVDYTGPLTANKRLRGRIVGSHLSKDYYYDIAHTEKTGIYGILEYDLTPKTLLSVGASGNWENSILNTTGLPRYLSGRVINWPISTCFCAPGGRQKAKKLEAFATLTQQIGSKWVAKINALYDYQYVDGKIVQVTAQIPDGATSAPGRASGYRTVNPIHQIALDASVVGEFRLFGRTHTLAVGANYQYVNGDGGFTSNYRSVTIPNIFTWDPYTYQMQSPTAKDYAAPYVRSKQYGIYGNLKLELFKWLHASIGMRYSETVLKATFVYSYDPNNPDIVPNLRDHSHSRPNLGLNLDITKNLTAYASYMSIYQPQNYLGARYALNGTIPPPVTGSNTEAGFKWQSRDKRFNASLAGFKIIQNGILGVDYNTPTGDGKLAPAIYDTRSKGLEFEFTGEVLPRWQVSANYTYNENTFTQNNFFNSTITERPKSSYTPKHLGKIWTTYRGAAGGPLAGVILGGGANIVSKSYQATSICGNTPTGYKCVPYNFDTKGYVTFSLKAGYQLTKNIEMSVNVENITNYKTFIATRQEQFSAYNYYIQPRSFLASLKLKW